MGDSDKQKKLLALGSSVRKGSGKVVKSGGKSREVDRSERERAEKEFLEAHSRRLSTPRTPPEASVEKEEGVVGGGVSLELETDVTDSAKESDVDDRDKKRRRGEGKTPPAAKKTKTSDEETEAEDETRIRLDLESGLLGPIETVEKALEGVLAWGKDLWCKKRVIGRPKFEIFESLVEKAKSAIGSVREERARMEGRLEERREIVNLIRAEMDRQGTERREKTEEESKTRDDVETYSAAVKKDKIPKISGIRRQVQGPVKEIFVRKDGADAEEVRKELKRTVDPKTIGVKVKKLMNRNGGVVIQVEDDGDLKKLRECEAIKEVGMTVGKPKKRKPVVMIYDIDKKMGDEENVREIYDKNVSADKFNFEDFSKEFRIRHRIEVKKNKRVAHRDRGDMKENWIVECSGRVRHELRKTDRLYIGWECCRVKDFVDVAQCYKCAMFGHVAKHCRERDYKCLKCGKQHKVEECKETKGGCLNCWRDRRRDIDHWGNSRECPIYKREVKRYFAGLDYGDSEIE